MITKVLTFLCSLGNGNDAGHVGRQFGEEGDLHCLSYPAADVAHQFLVLKPSATCVSAAITKSITTQAMSTFSPVGSRSSNGMRMCVCVCVCVCTFVHANMRACACMDRMNLKYALTCPHAIPMGAGQVKLQRIKDLPVHMPSPCPALQSQASKDQRLTCPHAIPMPRSPIPCGQDRFSSRAWAPASCSEVGKCGSKYTILPYSQNNIKYTQQNL